MLLLAALQLDPKVKSKTRGEQGGTGEVDDQDTPGTDAYTASIHEQALASISVKPRNYKLLSKLFPSQESTSESSGKARWQDFVTAMADAGFLASTNGGSAVTFCTSELEEGRNRRIVIHRPHPDPELSAVTMRSIWKRMNKWFGWDAKSFGGTVTTA